MSSVTLIDSPVANVANIARALRAVGASLQVTSDPAAVRGATKLVLPGVGSFRAAMDWLRRSEIDLALRDATRGGTPLLGICVGHQALFESSDEMGVSAGLGLIRGRVSKLATSLPIPQIGWNRVEFNGAPLFEGVARDTPFYFVNSFVAADVPDEIAFADYGTRFTAAIQKNNIYGVQFHPEKSSAPGLRVLRNFVWM
ncbi:MAG: imidazole glycerol phosphate synthase subunit HisH [Thermoanaerobaculia bacterium]